MNREAAAIVALVLLICGLASGAFAQEESCPIEGKASDRTRADPDLNRLKNREDFPSKFEPVTFQEILTWPAPPPRSNKTHRRHWPAEELRQIQKIEERAISLEGFLAGPPKIEGKESTNCYSEIARDIHMWLAPDPEDRRALAVVVEITPRVRAKHAAWSLKNLKRLAKDEVKLRVSGMALLDPEHPEQLEKSRATLYELHPVLKIEVWSAGAWREL